MYRRQQPQGQPAPSGRRVAEQPEVLLQQPARLALVAEPEPGAGGAETPRHEAGRGDLPRRDQLAALRESLECRAVLPCCQVVLAARGEVDQAVDRLEHRGGHGLPDERPCVGVPALRGCGEQRGGERDADSGAPHPCRHAGQRGPRVRLGLGVVAALQGDDPPHAVEHRLPRRRVPALDLPHDVLGPRHGLVGAFRGDQRDHRSGEPGQRALVHRGGRQERLRRVRRLLVPHPADPAEGQQRARRRGQPHRRLLGVNLKVRQPGPQPLVHRRESGRHHRHGLGERRPGRRVERVGALVQCGERLLGLCDVAVPQQVLRHRDGAVVGQLSLDHQLRQPVQASHGPDRVDPPLHRGERERGLGLLHLVGGLPVHQVQVGGRVLGLSREQRLLGGVREHPARERLVGHPADEQVPGDLAGGRAGLEQQAGGCPVQPDQLVAVGPGEHGRAGRRVPETQPGQQARLAQPVGDSLDGGDVGPGEPGGEQRGRGVAEHGQGGDHLPGQLAARAQATPVRALEVLSRYDAARHGAGGAAGAAGVAAVVSPVAQVGDQREQQQRVAAGDPHRLLGQRRGRPPDVLGEHVLHPVRRQRAQGEPPHPLVAGQVVVQFGARARHPGGLGERERDRKAGGRADEVQHELDGLGVHVLDVVDADDQVRLLRHLGEHAGGPVQHAGVEPRRRRAHVPGEFVGAAGSSRLRYQSTDELVDDAGRHLRTGRERDSREHHGTARARDLGEAGQHRGLPGADRAAHQHNVRLALVPRRVHQKPDMIQYGIAFREQHLGTPHEN